MSLNKSIRWLIQAIFKVRIYGALMLSAGFILSLFQLTKIGLDNSVTIWFNKADTTYESYVDFQERYGSDEIIIASIPIDFDRLKTYKEPFKQLQHRIEKGESVARSFSLFDATYPYLIGKNIKEILLFNETRSTSSQLKLFDQLSDLSNQLIAANRKHLFLYIQLLPSTQIEEKRSQTISTIIAEVKSAYPEAIISGPPVLNEAYNQSLFFEAVLFGGISLIVIICLLLVLLPNRRFIGFALTAILLPTIYLFGIIGYLGIPMNMVSALIPTLLLVYSLSDSVHILNALHRTLNNERILSQSEVLYQTIRTSIIPCSLTTLTTLAGYFALYFSGLPALKSMGLLASLGIVFAFVLSYLVVIIGFGFFNPLPISNKSTNPNSSQFPFENVTRSLQRISTVSKQQITGVTLLVLAFALIGSIFVTVDTDSSDLLAQSVTKDELSALEQQLGGSFRMQLDLTSTDAQSVIRQATLKRLSQFTTRLRDNKQIASVLSVESFIRFAQQRYPQLQLKDDDLSHLAKRFLSETPSQKAFFNFVDLERDVLSITVSFPQLSAKEIGQLIAYINQEFKKVFQDLSMEMKINGFATVFSQLNHFVVQSQLISFAIALLAIGLFLIFYLRSVKRAIIILIPNLIPIFATLSFMALFNIPLGVTTAMIAPILLGIAMDDTLHLLYHFRKYTSQHNSVSNALSQSLAYTTPALIISSISLSAGFLIIAFSRTPAVADFGALCVFAVLVALATDLLLLPALIRRFW